MSTVKAKVIEAMTGDPLSSVSVMVVDKNGSSLNQGVISDVNGKFSLTSDILDGNYLLVSYAGLAPLMVATSALNDTDYTELDLYPKDLQAVVVTPGNNKISWWWWILILGGLLYGASKIKKHAR